MSNERFGLSKFGPMAMSVADPGKSLAFYRDVLGMRFLFGAGGMAFFGCDEAGLMLAKRETPEFRTRSLVYFSVPDVHEAAKTLQARGVSFRTEPAVVTAQTHTIYGWPSSAIRTANTWPLCASRLRPDPSRASFSKMREGDGVGQPAANAGRGAEPS